MLEEATAAPAPRPRRTTWFALFAIVLVLGVATWWRLARGTESRDARGARQDAPIPVRLAPAELRDVPIYLGAIGTVTPLQTATVRARVDGIVEQIVFTEGQTVDVGDPLVILDTRPFRVAVAQAAAVQARDVAARRQGEVAFGRTRELHESGLAALADLQAAEASAAELSAGAQASRAALDAARLSLSYATVTAPIAGVTGIRQVDPGNAVHATDATGLVVITQMAPISVIFSLPQDDLPALLAQMAQRELPVDVLAREGRAQLASGVLKLVDNQVDPATATVRLKAEIANDDRSLWPRQLVEVRLLLETRRGALVVPDAAVQQGPTGTFVYVSGEGDTAAVRPITVERVAGGDAIVSAGLSPGEQVVVEGQSRLRPGVAMQPRASGGGDVPAGAAAAP